MATDIFSLLLITVTERYPTNPLVAYNHLRQHNAVRPMSLEKTQASPQDPWKIILSLTSPSLPGVFKGEAMARQAQMAKQMAMKQALENMLQCARGAVDNIPAGSPKPAYRNKPRSPSTSTQPAKSDCLHTKGQIRVLKAAKEHLDRLRQMADTVSRGRAVVLLAIDLEVHDRSDTITQFGVTFAWPHMRYTSHHHWLVQKHETVENESIDMSSYGFAYGTTNRLKLTDCIARVKGLLGVMLLLGDAYVVLHAGQNDKRWLARRGIDLGEHAIIDTSQVDMARRNEVNPRKLVKIAQEGGVELLGVAHNAGNDAAVTMATVMAQARELGGLATL